MRPFQGGCCVCVEILVAANPMFFAYFGLYVSYQGEGFILFLCRSKEDGADLSETLRTEKCCSTLWFCLLHLLFLLLNGSSFSFSQSMLFIG